MNDVRIHLRSLHTERTIPARRGAIFILALAIIIILSGLVLVFAQEMRTEAMTSANRMSYVQADAIEQGAEQWVLAQIDSASGSDAVTITETDAEAVPVGDPQNGGGYFWILSPDPTQDQTYAYGITDEAGKFNLNSLTSINLETGFETLPGMTPAIAGAIANWASPAGVVDPNGAQAQDYQGLVEPYNIKNAPFESVEELLLVSGMTPQILYGYDLNHDGVYDQAEKNASGQTVTLATGLGTGSDTRGLFNYVTCFSFQPAAAASTGTTTGGTGGINGASTTPTIVNVTTPNFSNKLGGVLAQIPTLSSKASNVGSLGLAYPSLATFYQAAAAAKIFDYTTYGLLADQLTAGAGIKHLINVNTASEQVLMTLPNLVQGDADTIVGARTNADTSNMVWFFTALGSDAKAASVADYVTDKSYQYSADIVAVTGDGRAFKRVRIVVDASSYATSTPLPAQIIYRKDVTSLGWPLPVEFRQALRAGQPPPDSDSDNSGLNLTGSK